MKLIKVLIPFMATVLLFSFGCTASQNIIDEEVVVKTISEKSEPVESEETLAEYNIAFQSNRDGNTQIYIMNIDGSGQKNLSESNADERAPVFSPLLSSGSTKSY
jgi:hypothetical protein